MALILYILYTTAHILLLLWGLRLWRRSRSSGLLLILLPIIGLIYDNAVIALGILIGEGPLLTTSNQGRFFLHAIITPMLIMAAVDMARRAGVSWAINRAVYAVFGLLTVGLIALGLAEFLRLELEPAYFGGTLRYVDTAVAGPPIPSIITIILIMFIGIFIWRKIRWPWLFMAALVMFIGSTIPPSIVGPVVGSGGEVVLLAGLLATEGRIQSETIQAKA